MRHFHLQAKGKTIYWCFITQFPGIFHPWKDSRLLLFFCLVTFVTIAMVSSVQWTFISSSKFSYTCSVAVKGKTTMNLLKHEVKNSSFWQLNNIPRSEYLNLEHVFPKKKSIKTQYTEKWHCIKLDILKHR